MELYSQKKILKCNLNHIEHHLLNMNVITTYLLRLRKHQYLKTLNLLLCQSWTKSSQGRESRTISTKLQEMF